MFDLVQIGSGVSSPPPNPSAGKARERPPWLRARASVGKNYERLKSLVTSLNLHTVCESAACPNIGDCWNRRTATFMILGNVCTRRCGFCAGEKGAPLEVDYDEPRRVADAVAVLGLRYAVVTSVNRDDRRDGGAELFALTIDAIRERNPGCRVEVLTPDFQGSHEAMEIVLAARPDVLNHNIETVPRLYRTVRLARTLSALARHVAPCQAGCSPESPTKSGMMLGLGESRAEVIAVMRDLRAHQVRHFHTRPVPAPLPEAPPHPALLQPGGVRAFQAAGVRDGLSARGGRAAGPQLLPCRRGRRRGGRLGLSQALKLNIPSHQYIHVWGEGSRAQHAVPLAKRSTE